jgi:hypothetical protein
MTIESLPEIEIFHGIFTLINVLFGIIVGLRISSKYIEYKRKELLTVGLSQIFSAAAYWSSIIAFLTIIFLNYEPGLTFHLGFHLIVPLGLIFWIYSISLLLYPKSQKKIVLFFVVLCIVYDLFLGIFLITDPSSLGRRTGMTLNETYLYINSFLLFSLLVVVITVILFLRSTLRSDNPKIRWKGKFIFLGMIISIIAAVIGIIIQDTPFTIILTRSLYMIGSIAAYIGWLMPEKVAKWLIKEDKK